MELLINRSTAPAFNLALEEHMLTRTERELIMLWRNERSVIIGRNQNAPEEVDMDFVRENNIAVVRRLSGGGAVFHDLGNINYTVICKMGEDDFGNYRKFAGPVCSFLHSLGVEASQGGRNDLLVGGAKISGNAQTAAGGRFMHHGTLLFSSDFSLLSKALSPGAAKIESKGVKSVRSRVTNIAGHLPAALSADVSKQMGADEFFERLIGYFRGHTDGICSLSDEDIKAVNRLVDEKYGTWEWNIGHSPAYQYSRQGRFPCGIVDVRLSVKEAVIREARIFGDFFGICDVAELEALLAGARHDKCSVGERLYGVDLGRYIHGITQEQFLSLF